MSSDFDWRSNEDSVVFPSTQGIAVYRNERGDFVIRQQAGPFDDDDSYIVIPPSQVQAVILAIQAQGGES